MIRCSRSDSVAQHLVQLVLQHDERRRLDRHHGVRVLDEVAEVGLLLADRRLQRDRLLGDPLDLGDPVRAMPISAASSSTVASRPSSWWSWRCTRASLLIVSTMCTGTRMVRAWSAIALVIAWRIHHVAYVENL